MKNDLFSFFIVFSFNALCFLLTLRSLQSTELKHVQITSMKYVLTGY